MDTNKSSELKEIGNKFFDSFKQKQAIEYYTKAIDLNPDDAEAYDLRGFAWLDLFELDKAIEDFEKAIQVDPEYHIALAHLGEIALGKNDYEKGEYYYQKAIAIIPENINYLSNLAVAKLQLNKDDESLDLCNLILKDSPINKWALDFRGGIWLKKKKYPEALKDYLRLREEDKNDVIVYNNIGYTYGKMGEIEKAKANLSLCINMDPEFAYAHDNLGYVHYLEKKYEKALELINHSLKLDPSNSYAYKNRALVYMDQYKRENAIEDLEKAIELGFTEDYGDEVEVLLSKLQKGYL